MCCWASDSCFYKDLLAFICTALKCMNYIMGCMAPPVHAFILHKIPGGKLTAVLLRYRAPPSLDIYGGRTG